MVTVRMPESGKWNSWASCTCSKMTSAGLNSFLSFRRFVFAMVVLHAQVIMPALGCETLEKSNMLRLKTATNKDLRRFTTIPVLKFAAKIRMEG